MEGGEKRNRNEPSRSGPCRDMKDGSSQTDCRIRGHGPRLSKVNLFTLLSLWMEMFPRDPPEEKEEEEEEEEEDSRQIRGMGLVVVQEGKVVGLHCSGPELHAGQAAVLQHGVRLAESQLYFSRRPCATCLKMIINAGVSQISFWPGDPEISMLESTPPGAVREEAALLDAVATEKLKSNSRPHVCVLLQPLTPDLLQFVNETSRDCDFRERPNEDDPAAGDGFNRERVRYLRAFSRRFLVCTSQQHKEILTQMGLENFCAEPYFCNLRHDMRELVEVLAAVAAGVPRHRHGFHREQSRTSWGPQEEVAQEVARHCIIQARLLAYRTEDPKVGVGAVIWAKGKRVGFGGTGHLSLVGCGYNAYPAGSKYAEYPQMDTKQEDRQRRKYRYMIHAEQNALTFRTRDIRAEEPTMLFVTKCPCDECVPLIRGAGITHIYTSDQDRDKDKGDISYLRFSSLTDISKFIWQRNPSDSPAASSHLLNGYLGKHDRQPQLETNRNKKLCTQRPSGAPSGC
uniref:Cytidine and dCMP deaminase domain-containing protein 1 n=1 Tax=Oryzias latipes TaxID=8090 RepID=A0A3P9HZ56_ORYLA